MTDKNKTPARTADKVEARRKTGAVLRPREEPRVEVTGPAGRLTILQRDLRVYRARGYETVPGTAEEPPRRATRIPGGSDPTPSAPEAARGE